MDNTSTYIKGLKPDVFRNILRKFRNEEIYLEDLSNHQYYKILSTTSSSLIVGQKDSSDTYTKQSFVHLFDDHDVVLHSTDKGIFLNNGYQTYRISSNILNLKDHLLRS